MTAIISFLIIIVIFGFIILKLSNSGIKPKKILDILTNDIRPFFLQDKSKEKSTKLEKIKITSLSITISLFIIMFFTGFVPTLFGGHFLTGLPLILHVTFAPLFALLLAFLIILYSYGQRLKINDYKTFSLFRSAAFLKTDTFLKVIFWLITFFSIPLLLSIILILYPILGTELQEFNITIHRLSATVISILFIFLMYSYILRKNDK